MEPLQQFGIGLIQSLQTLSPALDGVMNFFTFFGRIEFYLMLIPFVYWAVDKRIGIRALLILIFIDTTGVAFKLLFHQPRPYWVGGVKQMAEEASYGIASTHASDSLAVGGYLASRVNKLWVWILAVIFIFFIGLSRLYLGAHFPQDVLFGWVIGAVVLWASLKWGDAAAAWVKSKTLSMQILTGFLLSLLIILTGVLLRFLISDVSDPAVWSAYAVGARSLAHFFTLAGACFGAVAGYALMRHYARFQNSGTWNTRIIRYIVGIIGMLLIYIGLDVLFGLIAADETLVGYILRYIRYATVTLWVIWAAPFVFIKLKLAESDS